jgi:two-component system cell cycle response regulator DivK
MTTPAPLHALVVDDDANNAAVLGQLLEMMDIRYTSIQNPALLSRTLDKCDQIDLVFLDLEMPHLNGYDVFALLKSTPTCGEAPIIACSVHTSEMNNARAIGFDGFIGKPLDLDRFADRVQQILDGHAVWTTQ